MAKKLERYNGFREYVTPTTPVVDAYSQESPVTVHLYPFGPRLKCPIQFWIDVSYNRIAGGAFRLFSRTPIKGYCEKYTQWAADATRNHPSISFMKGYLANKFLEEPPTLWNNVRTSHFALFMLLYWGEYPDTPENTGRAGLQTCEVFQFNQSSPTTEMLKLVEFLNNYFPVETHAEEFPLPEKVGLIFHCVMKNWSALRGGSLERAFGFGEDGKQAYKNFMSLRKRINGHAQLDYH